MTNELTNFNPETGEIIENTELVITETDDYTIVKTEDGKFKKNMKYKKFFSRIPETEEDQIELYKVFNDSDSGIVTPLRNMISKELTVAHIFTAPYQSFDESTGNVTNGVTTIIEDTEGNYYATSYINDSLTFDTFDDMPMLIDTFGLSMAKTANQRQLTESKLLTNQVSSLTDSSANLKDRFMNAASLASNLSPTNLFGKFTDEYDYYRQQKAEQADMALEVPSISEQTNGNSFNIANNKFGIHIKYSKPTDSELNKIKKYYKLFGYQVNDQSSYLDKVNSMTVCNYVKFSGSWTIPGADVSIIEMMKAQFENGVRLWHNKDTRNPMIQNVLTNKIGG